MDTQEIKQYCVEQLARSERLLASERTAYYYEEQLWLRRLWSQAEQAQLQEKQVEQTDTQNALLLRIAIGIECLENVK